MKNFSELLATKQKLDLDIQLSTISSPMYTVNVNNNVYCQFKHIKLELSLLDDIHIEIKIMGKDYNKDSTSAVIIDKIAIDGFSIPVQLATYNNDHNYTDPTNHLGFNGTWKVDINKPFYQWKHEVLNRGWLLSPTKY